jgi:hypothetical protein
MSSRRSGAWWTWHNEWACTLSCKIVPHIHTDPAIAAAVADEMGILHARDGLLASGKPVGAPHFIAAHARQCVDTTLGLLSALDRLELPVQDHRSSADPVSYAWLTCRASASGRMWSKPSKTQKTGWWPAHLL